MRKSPCESQHAASVKPSIAFTVERPWLELDPPLLPLASSTSSPFGLLFLVNKLLSSFLSLSQLPFPPFLWAASQISRLPIHTGMLRSQ